MISHLPILAIDPGASTGIAIVSPPPIRLVHHVHHKFARKRERTPSEVIAELVEQYHPRLAIIEDQFHRRSLDTLKKLARTAGRWMEACIAAGLEVEWVNPRSWQSKILRGVGRNREQLIAAYTAVARSETRIANLQEDVSAAYCIGRYGAVAFLGR